MEGGCLLQKPGGHGSWGPVACREDRRRMLKLLVFCSHKRGLRRRGSCGVPRSFLLLFLLLVWLLSRLRIFYLRSPPTRHATFCEAGSRLPRTNATEMMVTAGSSTQSEQSDGQTSLNFFLLLVVVVVVVVPCLFFVLCLYCCCCATALSAGESAANLSVGIGVKPLTIPFYFHFQTRL